MKKTLLVLALVAGITSFAQNAQAALITINIGPSGFDIGGVNAGLADGDLLQRDDFPLTGAGRLDVSNGFFGVYGLLAFSGLRLAAGGSDASPLNFSLNDSIGSSVTWTSSPISSSFLVGPSVSPDFGSGSYMGFMTGQGNYGWLEVTWTARSQQFQILSGAYEDQVGVAILAGAGGAGPAAVPEPGTWAAAALLAGGAGFMRWRKRAKVA
jgi:hypothetical protein